MKTQYNYFHFDLASVPVVKKDTQTWFCISNKYEYFLGVIKWFPKWRQYCFFPEEETVFSIGCMNDIVDFINQLNEERKSNETKTG